MSDITKYSTNPKEIKAFKKAYSNADINTEVISNLLQPFHIQKDDAIKKYCEFWFDGQGKESFAVKMLVSHYAPMALEHLFGPADFKFKGNRDYTNYILSYDGLVFITPAKPEVVMPENIPVDFYNRLVKFDFAFNQLVLDFLLQNEHSLQEFDKNELTKLKSLAKFNKTGSLNLLESFLFIDEIQPDSSLKRKSGAGKNK